MGKTDIKSLPLEQLEQWAVEYGEKKFRAKQLYQWMHVKLVDDPEQMSNLSAAFRQKIRENCTFTVLKQVTMQESALDGTRKYLFELEDHNMVESVLMRYKHGNSVCISSQVGCRMGCRFCASTLDGLVRNLTPAEMLEQIYRISADTGERVSNVVVMGTGEPLKTAYISVSGISRFPPAVWYRGSVIWRRKGCRSHWHCHCTHPIRRNVWN